MHRSKAEFPGPVKSYPSELSNPFEENHGQIYQTDTENKSSENSDQKGPSKMIPFKKYFSNDDRGSPCPFTGCYTVTRKLKSHAFSKHLPGIFDSCLNPRSSDLAKQRMEAIKALGGQIKGAKKSPAQLVTLLNTLQLIPRGATITDTDEVAMLCVCNTLQLEKPTTFTLLPVNHVAALIHWRPMLHLAAGLPRQMRMWFRNWQSSDGPSPDLSIPAARLQAPSKYLEDGIEQCPTSRKWNVKRRVPREWNEQQPGSSYWNEQQPGPSDWNEQQPGLRGWNEKQPGPGGWNEQQPDPSGWNEKQPGLRGWNEKQPGPNSWNEQQPGLRGWNEKQPGPNGWNEQQPGPSGWNEQYSGSSKWNEQNPVILEPMVMPRVSDKVPKPTVTVGVNLDEQLCRMSQGASMEVKAEVRVMVQGGLCLYSDPSTFPSRVPQVPGCAVAVGIHPKHTTRMSEREWNHLRLLCFESDVALGELGLDRTQPASTWLEQDRQLKKLLSLAQVDMPVILHFRKSESDLYGQDVYSRGLVLMQDICSPGQAIHLHCFQGTREVINEWLHRFPNAYFGFTELVACFDKKQVLALKMVPLNCLILEIDAPNLDPQSAIVNKKGFITEAARNVAAKRGISLECMLLASSSNTQQLYNLQQKMAKQISQKTFDDVVRENMVEFEMEAEEAVEDAVQQFQSQGVNLGNIVKDASMYSGGDGETPAVHPVVAALETLSLKLEESPTKGEIIQLLDTIKSECDIDLARRCLAGTNNAYSIIIKACEKYKDDTEVLKTSLRCLCSLVNGQPDVLDDAGTTLLMNLLTAHNTNTDILEFVARAIKLTCIKHEGNRQRFVAENLIPQLSELLPTFKNSPVFVKEACGCFRVLTLDDDIRVPFGKAHDHAKMIVTEGNALKTILNICEDYKEEKNVLGELFSTLACLAVRDEFCQEVMDLGGLDLILKTFQHSLKDKNLTKQVLTVLKALARNDGVKVAIVKAGGIEFIVAALMKHQSNPVIAEAACATITTVVLRNSPHVARVIACGGHQQVIQVMKIHKTESQLQKCACMALRNLVARNRENCDKVLELGAEGLINEARLTHPDCCDEAKAALRDLGCSVELKELWKGENRGIQA